MVVTMIASALIIDAVFSALGLIPGGPRPTRADIFEAVSVNYKLVLNVLGFAVFAALFALDLRNLNSRRLRA